MPSALTSLPRVDLRSNPGSVPNPIPQHTCQSPKLSPSRPISPPFGPSGLGVPLSFTPGSQSWVWGRDHRGWGWAELLPHPAGIGSGSCKSTLLACEHGWRHVSTVAPASGSWQGTVSTGRVLMRCHDGGGTFWNVLWAEWVWVHHCHGCGHDAEEGYEVGSPWGMSSARLLRLCHNVPVLVPALKATGTV